jgi:hypothetical protein
MQQTARPPMTPAREAVARYLVEHPDATRWEVMRALADHPDLRHFLSPEAMIVRAYLMEIGHPPVEPIRSGLSLDVG